MTPLNLDAIWEKVNEIDPVKYGKTRNFIDGAVTRLSPYISRGVISTKDVFHSVLNRGFDPKSIEKFIQELAWRDYWQQIWIEKGVQINEDLKTTQTLVSNHGIPKSIVEASTGIEAIDLAIRSFYESGYLHNHLRMYIASLACNIGKSHWRTPARWMYYHLLDGDWASNALSWQWVAGSNSKKKYYANQNNINKYCYTDQHGTFLDISYDEFESMDTPSVLEETIIPELKTPLPAAKELNIDKALPLLIYNLYNLDPLWKEGLEANRILLLEPSVFSEYPVSGKTIEFILALAGNIPGIKVFTGEFEELMQQAGPEKVFFKEHPLNRHYSGIEEPRDWMFDVKGYYPSFFAFWKKCKRQIDFK